MNRYIMTDETIKELSRCADMLYKTFHKANMQLVQHPERSIQSDFHLDYCTTPWKFYYYMDADVQISIIRIDSIKSKSCFTIEMYNVETDLPHCDKIHRSLELYKHCYGYFEDIDTAISVYKSIVCRLVSQYSGNEYTKLANYTHKKLLSKLENKR